MNDELITRLRAQAVQLRYRGMGYVADLLATAADALEAAQARTARLEQVVDEATDDHAATLLKLGELRHTIQSNAKTFAASIAEERARTADARAERDAEAALADQLAEALFVMHQGFCPLVVSGVDTGAASDAYRAHRERRTTPTKENTDG